MKPYYQDDYATIYHGDCREILPTLPEQVDLLLTDPPYGIGEHGGKARTRGIKLANHERMGWDNETPSLQLFNLMRRRSVNQIVWGGNYFTDKLPVSRGWLFWDKLMGGDFSDGELAWTSLDMVLRRIVITNKGRRNEHPTQKPLELMTWCFTFLPECKTVGDPFLGSGTTLRAAKDLGKTGWGIEREERYCEISARRLQQEVFAL